MFGNVLLLTSFAIWNLQQKFSFTMFATSSLALMLSNIIPLFDAVFPILMEYLICIWIEKNWKQGEFIISVFHFVSRKMSKTLGISA